MRRHALSLAIAVALLVLGTARPAAAQCGLGNQCAVVDSVFVTPAPAPAGGQADVTCVAHDPDGTITNLVFTVDGGTFGNGTTRLRIVGGPSATVQWNAPNTPGTTYHVTCTPWDNGTAFGGPQQGAPSTVAIDVETPSLPPRIVSLVATPTELLPGDAAIVVASVQNPSGGALTYDWQAADGTFTGSGDTVVWTAPTATGAIALNLTVTSNNQSARAAVLVTVVFAHGGPSFEQGGGLVPQRLASDDAGNFYIGDPRRSEVLVLSALGGVLRHVPVAGSPGGIAVARSGDLFVGDLDHATIEVHPPLGPTRIFDAGGALRSPVDLALDPATGTLYVADGAAEAVQVIDATGATVARLSLPGTDATGIAFEPTTSSLYVADARKGRILVLGTDGTQQRVIGGFGIGAGQMTRVAGLALGGGLVYAVDPYQGVLQIFQLDGTWASSVGVWGDAVGQLRVPLDPVLDRFGRLAVTSADTGRVEVFMPRGATTASCPGDSDCDGMPDAWELAHGFNPSNPADAWLDTDGDGLPNVLEFQHGTDPRNRDTDGDGVSDGDEILRGQNPLDPSDNRPVANAGADQIGEPTRFVLDGRGSSDPNHFALTYAWRQIAGDAVKLDDATAAVARFVARSAGTRRFGLRVWNGHGWSAEDEVEVRVIDVAPTADAGFDISASKGDPVALDGRFSTDANGDALAFKWTQIAGPSTVRLANAGSATPTFTPSRNGIYSFALVSSGGGQDSAPARVNVLVDEEHDPTPTALTAARIDGHVGDTIVLDGSDSKEGVHGKLVYGWRQTGGPSVVLANATRAVASLVPATAGVYSFELVVADKDTQSLPRAVTAVIASATASPAVANAGSDQRVRVLDDVTLGCGDSASPDGSVITCRWRQVEGVHVPLVDAGPTSVKLVPIDAGTYVFELAVSSAIGAGTTARVTIVADDPNGNQVPVAAGAFLHKRGKPEGTLVSTGSFDAGGGGALHAEWTQVDGPHLHLETQGDGVSVKADGKNASVFELRVDDGLVRSAPARVVVAR